MTSGMLRTCVFDSRELQHLLVELHVLSRDVAFFAFCACPLSRSLTK